MSELDQIKSELAELKALSVEIDEAEEHSKRVEKKLSDARWRLWNHKNSIENKIRKLGTRILEIVT